MTRALTFTLSFFLLASLAGCQNKEEAYSGIADENGIVTGNSRPVPDKDPKAERQRVVNASGIIPDW